MLGAVFFAIVVTLLTGHYLLVERPRRVAGEAAVGPRIVPLRDTVNRLPAGIFLQPTFTWGQVRPTGDVEIGVHPMLLALVGPEPELAMPGVGEHVDKGDPLMKVASGDRSLVVKSPLAGRVTAAGRAPHRQPGWPGRADPTCAIEPEGLSDEVPTWMIGKAAVDWSRLQYGRIRDHLLERSMHPDTGLALADGGELPVGALSQLEAAEWAEFELEFLSG